MTSTFLLALVRHVLTFGGGALVARGVADQATVDAVSGALLTIVGAVWSLAEKRERAG